MGKLTPQKRKLAPRDKCEPVHKGGAEANPPLRAREFSPTVPGERERVICAKSGS